MITILNETSRFLRIPLSRGKVLRLGPRKEGQIRMGFLILVSRRLTEINEKVKKLNACTT